MGMTHITSIALFVVLLEITTTPLKPPVIVRSSTALIMVYTAATTVYTIPGKESTWLLGKRFHFPSNRY
jgi:hypothetical protein